jgi:hypothetical protein
MFKLFHVVGNPQSVANQVKGMDCAAQQPLQQRCSHRSVGRAATNQASIAFACMSNCCKCIPVYQQESEGASCMPCFWLLTKPRMKHHCQIALGLSALQPRMNDTAPNRRYPPPPLPSTRAKARRAGWHYGALASPPQKQRLRLYKNVRATKRSHFAAGRTPDTKEKDWCAAVC